MDGVVVFHTLLFRLVSLDGARLEKKPNKNKSYKTFQVLRPQKEKQKYFFTTKTMSHHLGSQIQKYKRTKKQTFIFCGKPVLITPVGSISLLRNLIDGALLSTLALVIGNLCSENKAVVCFSSYCMHAQS